MNDVASNAIAVVVDAKSFLIWFSPGSESIVKTFRTGFLKLLLQQSL
jgi:hypothetical protein